jgi:glycine oxidase
MKRILIVGQGIAGTVLAETLQNHGATVHIWEAGYPDSASQVAAGVINPVTGKRYVKTWMLEEMYPFAQQFYQKTAQKLGIEVWNERAIVRLLSSIKEENDWAARCHLPEYEAYIKESKNASTWQGMVKLSYFFGQLSGVAQVDFKTLLASFRSKMQEKDVFFDKKFDFNKTENEIKDFDLVIFCEGYRGQENPFFSHLPWKLAKGEALIIRLDATNIVLPTELLKKTMTLVPLADGTYWVGATNEWQYQNSFPTLAFKDLIVNELAQMLEVPFEVINHVAAVRPTVEDHRPFIGIHPKYPKIGIFNGLGTKGALLAPYWAEHFADYLLKGCNLEKNVNIERYEY